MINNSEISEELNMKTFEKIILITNPEYSVYMEKFVRSKISVFCVTAGNVNNVAAAVKCRRKFEPSRTLWLTHPEVFKIDCVEKSVLCTTCKEPLEIHVLPSTHIITYSNYANEVQSSFDELIKKVNTFLNAESSFAILPPFPPSFVPLEDTEHNLYHKIVKGRNKYYFTTFSSLIGFQSLYDELSKQMIPFSITELNKINIPSHFILEYFKITESWDSYMQIETQTDKLQSEEFTVKYTQWFKHIKQFLLHILKLSSSENLNMKPTCDKKSEKLSVEPTGTIEVKIKNGKSEKEYVGSKLDLEDSHAFSDDPSDNFDETLKDNAIINENSEPEIIVLDSPTPSPKPEEPMNPENYDHIAFICFCKAHAQLVPREQELAKNTSVIVVKSSLNWCEEKSKFDIFTQIHKSILFIVIGSINLLGNEYRDKFCINEKCTDPLLCLRLGQDSNGQIFNKTVNKYGQFMKNLRSYFEKLSAVFILTPMITVKCTSIPDITKSSHQDIHKLLAFTNAYLTVEDRERWSAVANIFQKDYYIRMLKEGHTSNEIEKFGKVLKEIKYTSKSNIFWVELSKTTIIVDTDYNENEFKIFLNKFVDVLYPDFKNKAKCSEFSAWQNIEDKTKNFPTSSLIIPTTRQKEQNPPKVDGNVDSITLREEKKRNGNREAPKASHSTSVVNSDLTTATQMRKADSLVSVSDSSQSMKKNNMNSAYQRVLENSTIKNFHLKILVTSSAAVRINGDGGKTLQKLQRDTNSRVTVSIRSDLSDRVCSIVGSVDSVLKALFILIDIIKYQPSFVNNKLLELKFVVRDTVAKSILGEGRQNIQHIEKISKSFIYKYKTCYRELAEAYFVIESAKVEDIKTAFSMMLDPDNFKPSNGVEQAASPSETPKDKDLAPSMNPDSSPRTIPNSAPRKIPISTSTTITNLAPSTIPVSTPSTSSNSAPSTIPVSTPSMSSNSVSRTIPGLTQSTKELFYLQTLMAEDSKDNKIFQFTILLEKGFAKAVLGANGEGLAQLQKNTNSQIKVSENLKNLPGNCEYACSLKGTAQTVWKVLLSIIDIKKAKTRQGNEIQVTFVVPDSTATLIIGKKEENILQIKNESKAYMRMYRKKDYPFPNVSFFIVRSFDVNFIKTAFSMIFRYIAQDLKEGTSNYITFPIVEQQNFQDVSAYETPKIKDSSLDKKKEVLNPNAAPQGNLGKDKFCILKILLESDVAETVSVVIQDLQKDFRSTVKLSKKPEYFPDSSKQVCLIAGTAEAVLKAVSSIIDIKEVMSIDGSDVQVEFVVPDSTAKLIIGENVNIMQQIIKESKAFIMVCNKKDYLSPNESCFAVKSYDVNCIKTAFSLVIDYIVTNTGNCSNLTSSDVSLKPSGSNKSINTDGISEEPTNSASDQVMHRYSSQKFGHRMNESYINCSAGTSRYPFKNTESEYPLSNSKVTSKNLLDRREVSDYKSGSKIIGGYSVGGNQLSSRSPSWDSGYEYHSSRDSRQRYSHRSRSPSKLFRNKSRRRSRSRQSRYVSPKRRLSINSSRKKRSLSIEYLSPSPHKRSRKNSRSRSRNNRSYSKSNSRSKSSCSDSPEREYHSRHKRSRSKTSDKSDHQDKNMDDEFSLIYILNALETVCDKCGELRKIIKSFITIIRSELEVDLSKALRMIKKDNIFLELIINKLTSRISSTPVEEIEMLSKAIEWTNKLKEFAKKAENSERNINSRSRSRTKSPCLDSRDSRSRKSSPETYDKSLHHDGDKIGKEFSVMGALNLLESACDKCGESSEMIKGFTSVIKSELEVDKSKALRLIKDDNYILLRMIINKLKSCIASAPTEDIMLSKAVKWANYLIKYVENSEIPEENINSRQFTYSKSRSRTRSRSDSRSRGSEPKYLNNSSSETEDVFIHQDSIKIGDKFSVIGALNLLERVCDKCGALSGSIKIFTISVKPELEIDRNKALRLIKDENNILLLRMTAKKLESYIASAPLEEIEIISKAIEWTNFLIEYVEKEVNSGRTINCRAIAESSLNETPDCILTLIKSTFLYDGILNPTNVEINETFVKVSRLQFEMMNNRLTE